MNLSNVHFILSTLYAHSSCNERWRLFLRQLQRLVKLWAADQSLKVTQIMPGCSADKKKIFWNGCTSCRKMRAVLIFYKWMEALAFHLCGWQIHLAGFPQICSLEATPLCKGEQGTEPQCWKSPIQTYTYTNTKFDWDKKCIKEMTQLHKDWQCHRETWKNQAQNASQRHFHCFLKDIWILKSGCSLKSPTHTMFSS